MADLFTTGAAPGSLTVFLNAVMNFAVNTCGFTRQTGVGLGTNGADIEYLNRNGMNYVFMPLTASDIEIRSYMSINVNAAGSWGNGSPRQAGDTRFQPWENAGPFTNYWIFTDIDLLGVHAVLEARPGIFCHLSFGEGKKRGAFTGGHYITAMGFRIKLSGDFSTVLGSNVNLMTFAAEASGSGTETGYVYNYLGADSTMDFARMGAGASASWQTAIGTSIYQGHHVPAIDYTPQQISGRAIGFPIDVFVLTGGLYAPLIHVPGVRLINLGSTLNNGDLILNNEWQVFPLTERNGDEQNAPNSFDYGMAYQRVTVPD